METLLSWDRMLFLAINHAHAAWLDPIMIFASGRLTWLPFYLLLIFLVWRLRGWRTLLWFLLGVALAVLLADRGSVVLFKDIFQRLRPGYAQELIGQIHFPNGDPAAGYSFVSSHAANVCAIATFGTLFVRRRLITWLLSAWAILVCYSRVYMGQHYPGDVFCGALLGVAIGLLLYVLLQWLRSLRIGSYRPRTST